MVSVSIEVDSVTLGDFRTQMNRLVTELGKSPEEACRMGAVALLKSLQSQTRIAPKTRKVKTDPNWKSRWVDSKGNRRFLMEKWNRKTGAVEDVRLWAPDLDTAKQSKAAKLFYRGLAKASWGWAAQRLFPTKGKGYQGSRPVRETFSVSKAGRGNEHTITIVNRLDYIGLALRGGESAAVGTAMKKATKAMFGRIEARMKGKIR